MNDNPPIRRILEECRTIAVVGISDDPSRASHYVSEYMQKHGYRIIPVNPKLTEVLGEKCYPDLRSVPEKVDLVNVFRRPADCLRPAQDAVAMGARALWLQLGIANEEARQVAEDAGLLVVMDRCIMVEHRRI
ncbi:MAG TPA: CoA-binding protein [Rhodocyclaceae bacterium]|nr:CoA-binding protein [Rhodocyclaceae bacterium]